MVCYCHTPPRYLYGLATARKLDGFIYKIVNFPLQLILHFYRLLDYKYAQNVDQFLANSRTVRNRIQKYYRRQSLVVYPPVDLSKIKIANKTKKYYLTGGRLAFAKRYDIAISVCKQLSLPLKIYGRDFAGYEKVLKSMAGPTIEFLGEVSQDQKQRLMGEAKGFFFCSDNEDFGITPVESMSCGTPVIGYNSGGTSETIVDGITGVLFNDLTVQSCLNAVKRFEKLSIKPADCIAQSLKFSKEEFVSQINNLVAKT